MDFQEFSSSIANIEPDSNLSTGLKSLWYEKKGNWQKAHEIVQNESERMSKLIHAYLHRKEGDLWNANYWYKAANETMSDLSLNHEWENLVKLLCK